jgi:hypothetical protein
MKTLAGHALFRLFDRVIRPANYLDGAPTWSKDGVDWSHVRHSFRGVNYGFSVDVFTGTRPGKKGWTVMLVREGWWTGPRPDPIRTPQWANLIAGNRADALAWFQSQEIPMTR